MVHTSRFPVLVSLALLAVALTGSGRPHSSSAGAPALRPGAGAERVRLPLSFEANQGQADARVKYLARGRGWGLSLSGSEAGLVLRAPEPEAREARKPWRRHPEPAPQRTASLRMRLVGGDARARVRGVQELPGKANYFLGRDPKQWRANVPTYAKVRCEDVYPGVDLVYYGKEGDLEYDFVAAPGADPSTIRLAYTGADRLELDARGDLLIHTPTGELRQQRPVVYQVVNGVRQAVSGEYVLLPDACGCVGVGVYGCELHRKAAPLSTTEPASQPPTINAPNLAHTHTPTHPYTHTPTQVCFNIGDYDRSRPLIIDPVLQYSTYFGGTTDQTTDGVTVDANGSAYIVGYGVGITTTPGAYQTALQGGMDAYVAKLAPDGGSLLFSTYLGGGDSDYGYGVALDGQGNVCVVGTTYSSNFPVQNAVQDQRLNTNNVFLTKLNPAGNGLVWSTYLGGGTNAQGLDVAVDGQGNPVVTGWYSYPGVGYAAVLVEKIQAAGGARVFSKTLGDIYTANFGEGCAADAQGNVYVTGSAGSGFDVTANAYQSEKKYFYDCFVTKLDPLGNPLYSTYFGGDGGDSAGLDIAADANGLIYVTGETDSRAFPIKNGFQTAYGGGGTNGLFNGDAFVAKFNPNAAGAASLLYSSYLGGNGGENTYDAGIAVDTQGVAYVTGETQSTTGFPLTANAQQRTNRGGLFDAFVAKVNTNAAGAASLVYSSYLGGTGRDEGHRIALGPNGTFYVAGSTASTNFPVVRALQGLNRGGTEGFVTRLGEGALGFRAAGAITVAAGLRAVGLAGVTVTAGGKTAITGADGSFILFELPPGTYTLTVSKPGYLFTPASRQVTISSGNVGGLNFSAAQPTYTVSGTTTLNGAALAGVTVSAGGKSATSTTTGAYTITGLLAGTYNVLATKTGYGFSPSSRQVTLGPNATGINFAAVPGHSISGKVALANGTAVAGVTVTAGGRSATTGTGGFYTIPDLSGGTYTVAPAKDGYTFAPVSRSVTVGTTNVTAIDFTATRVFTLSGTVTTNGAGQAGVTIAAGTKRATTDASGAYTLTGLVAGTYTVTPSKTGYTFTPANRGVTLTTANVTGINFTAAPPTYSISGLVKTAAGAAVAGVTVTTGSSTATTGTGGGYTLAGLPAGTYTVTPGKTGYTFTPASKSVTITTASVSGVSFTAVPVTIPAPKADYRFQGTLASSVGTPPALANIAAGNQFVTDTVDGQPRQALSFPVHSGVQLSPSTSVVSAGVYSIVMLFKLQDVSGYKRLLDTKNATIDQGLYSYSGALRYYPDTSGSGGSSIPANTFVQVVLTRDASKNVVGYVDGAQKFTFVDSSDHATISAGVLKFFKDDGSYEESAGTVARIRLYDVALTATQVTSLDRAAPPGATYSVGGSVTLNGAGLGAVAVSAGGKTATTTSTGAYTITGLPAGTYTVAPAKTGYSFTPTSRSVTITSASVTGQNFSASTATGPVPKADYRFQNSYASSAGTAPALTAVGTGANAFATETVDGVQRTVLTFPQGNGVLLSSATSVIPAGTYTMVMLFRLADTASYKRIVDLKTPSEDNGLYCHNGALEMYPVGSGPATVFQANTYIQVVLTRDSAGALTGYANGAQQFSVSDGGNRGVISGNALQFFKDYYNYNAAGAVARIRLYDRALTTAEVGALDK